MRLTASIPEAAKLIGIGRSWAHDYFKRLDRQNPEFGLLVSATGDGKIRARLRVDLKALFELKRGNKLQDLKDSQEKIMMLEADVLTLKNRLSRLERCQK